MAVRRPLSKTEQKNADTFRKAWAEKKRREKLSQMDAGAALDMSASAFAQYINGKVAIGVQAGLALCRYLDVPVGEVDFPALGGLGSVPPSRVAALSLVKNMTEEERLALSDAQVENLFAALTQSQVEAALLAAVESMSDRERIRLAQIALDGVPLLQAQH